MDTNIFLKSNTLIAHRGLFNNDKGVIENTIQAFEKAIEYKYIIELDVHSISDNIIVVFHDDNLKRLTGIDKKIKECTYNELRKIRLNNTDSYIPTLEEVLQLVDGKVPILIELKYNKFVGVLEKELMKILSKYTGEYAIQSFNPLSIIWFRIKHPHILRGQIVSDFKYQKINPVKSYLLTKMCFNIFSQPNYISFNIHDVELDKIESFKKKYTVLGWTVKTQEEYMQLREHYDNLICEQFIYPE